MAWSGPNLSISCYRASALPDRDKTQRLDVSPVQRWYFGLRSVLP